MANYLLTNQQSQRLIFRNVEPTDFDTWLEFCTNKDSLQYIFSQQNLLLKPTERCKIWFDKVFHRYENNLGGMNALIEKDTNAFVGMCGLLVQTVDGMEEIEIGYSLMPNFRKKGFAREAAKTCRDFAFTNNFTNSLISIIDPNNLDSIKVAINNGMTLAKQTIFQDTAVNIYRITKDEWTKLKD